MQLRENKKRNLKHELEELKTESKVWGLMATWRNSGNHEYLGFGVSAGEKEDWFIAKSTTDIIPMMWALLKHFKKLQVNRQAPFAEKTLCKND